MLCHGSGNGGEGCCFIEGEVCPLRWKLEGGHIFDATGADLGEVEAYIDSIIPNVPGRRKAKAQVQGVTNACRAAVEVLVANAKLLNDRPGFEAAWLVHPDYVSLVAPLWRAIEARYGLPAGSLDCSNWKGTGAWQCCFAEDPTTNDANAAGLSADGRTIRELGGTT